jgi:hypothetical protein
MGETGCGGEQVNSKEEAAKTVEMERVGMLVEGTAKICSRTRRR